MYCYKNLVFDPGDLLSITDNKKILQLISPGARDLYLCGANPKQLKKCDPNVIVALISGCAWHLRLLVDLNELMLYDADKIKALTSVLALSCYEHG